MSTPNPTHIIAAGMRDVATEGRNGTPGTRDDGQLWGAFPNTMTLTDLAAHVVSKLTDAGYSIVKLPESHPPSDQFQDWWTDDGGWTVERHVGSPQIRLTFDEDDAMETSPDGEFYPFARLTASEAHDLGVALLASAAAAEGEKP